jgi:hypothetical protein
VLVLHIANEGSLVTIVSPAAAGEVVADAHHFAQMTTGFGSGRIVDWLAGEQLPRICRGRCVRILSLVRLLRQLGATAVCRNDKTWLRSFRGIRHQRGGDA